MSAFIQNNVIWIVPVITIIFTILTKMSAKPDYMSLNYIDYLDFGFDMSITSMVVLLTGENYNSAIWLLVLFMMLIMITSLIVNRVGWNKETKQQRLLGVIIPDLIGIILLVVATLHSGGVIK